MGPDPHFSKTWSTRIFQKREIYGKRVSFSYDLGRVALQRMLVYKGPSIYFTI